MNLMPNSVPSKAKCVCLDDSRTSCKHVMAGYEVITGCWNRLGTEQKLLPTHTPANHLLPEAEKTVINFCNTPSLTD